MQAGSELSEGLGRDDFPWGKASLYDTKKRMWEWLFDDFKLIQPIWIAYFQLCHEMTPFIFELTLRDSEKAQRAHLAELHFIEVITTPKRLDMNFLQVGSNEICRI
jgi:hypothetical protein